MPDRRKCEKKKNTWLRLTAYAGAWQWMIYASLLISALATAAGTVPYIKIFDIVSESVRQASDMRKITTDAWFAVIWSIISTALYFIAITLSHLFAFHIESGIRIKTMEKLFSLSLGFFQNHSSGRIRKIIDDNAAKTHDLMAHHTPDFAGMAVFPIIMAIVFFSYDWKLGLVSLFSLTASIICMIPLFSGKNKDAVKKNMDAQEQMAAAAVEYIRGIPVVKIFQQSVYSFKAFRKAVADYSAFAVSYTVTARKWMVLAAAAGNLTIILLVLAGIHMMAGGLDAEKAVSLVLFYILFTTYCAAYIGRLMQSSRNLFQAAEVIKRLDEIGGQAAQRYGKEETFTGHQVEFRQVSFTYQGAKQPVLDGINLVLKEGCVAALVGRSGSGKSTLAALLPRFYAPDSGQILIGGKDITVYSKKALMKEISFVFQNHHLFKESILANIKKGKPDASEAEVWEACRKAGCSEFIGALPDGLDTVIGSAGVYVSGGEEQRILLARAFLKNAPIVVLDEATAFADPENEQLIRKAFTELSRGRTVLMIAHRLSSVIDSDAIAVLDKGRIVEQGGHRELLDRKGIYAGMWAEYQKSAVWKADTEGKYV